MCSINYYVQRKNVYFLRKMAIATGQEAVAKQTETSNGDLDNNLPSMGTFTFTTRLSNNFGQIR